MKRNLKHVGRLAKMEKSFTKQGGREHFDIRETMQQCEEARTRLIPIYEKQKTLLVKIKDLIPKLKATELLELLKTS